MLFDRRILVLSAILAGHDAVAFTPVNLGGGVGGSRISVTSSGEARNVKFIPLLGASSRLSSSLLAEAATDTGASTDVSIPYDSAARLAYADWCTKFGKSPDDTRYMAFKSNYEQISVANVVAAKEARDSDIARPKDLELNEYGDMTEEEYMAIMGGGAAAAASVSAPEKGPLETVMEASAAQSEASVALAEAADALAEEEEKLAKQLGLNSVEELEDAIDAMEGFDTDGGAFDTSDVREARVRSAYIDWCKSYDKSVDESRFPTFSSNFLAMEEYSKENGREMVLNKYADCTEEEYRELTAPAAPTIQEMKAEAKMIETPKAVVEPPKAVVEPPKAVEAVAPVVKVEKKVEVEKVKVVPPPLPAPSVEAVKPVIKVEATPKLPPKPQPVIAPVIELSLEEQAIADARAMREKEDLQVAKRRARDEAAAEMERQKAVEAMKKQERYASTIIAPKPSKVEAVTKAVTPVVTKKEESVVKKTQASPFASIFGGAKLVEKVVPAKSVVEKKAQVTPVIKSVAAKKVEPKADIFASIFGNSQAKPVSTKAPPVKPVEVTKAAAKPVQKKVSVPPAVLNFYQASSAPDKPVQKKVSVPPAVLNFYQASSAPKKTQPKSVPEIQKSIVQKKSQPKSQPFNFFQSAAPKPAPLPEPVVVEKKTPPKSQPFSFFQSAAPKPAPKVAPKPAPVPPARKSPTLSLFAAKTPFTPAQKEVVVEKKTPPKSDPFSFFQTAAPKAAPQTVVKPSPVSARKSPTLSLFNAKTPASPPPKASAVEDKQNARGSPTFSLFGGTKAVAPTAQPVIVEQKKAVPKTGSFSLFGATKPSGGTIAIQKKAVPAAKQTMFAPKKSAPVADNIPIIGKFKQNADGSITGVVRNSKSFRTGTEITTSPVPRGAKAGSIVTTSSGSKYRLE